MDLRQLRYFIAVAEERSFTLAARRLNLSQPPLSQHIQALEAELGTSLLYRTSRKVELTQAGEAMLLRGRAILQQVKSAEDEVRSIGAGLIGTLDLGATGSILRGRLAELLAAYREGGAPGPDDRARAGAGAPDRRAAQPDHQHLAHARQPQRARPDQQAGMAGRGRSRPAP
ncbi:LysR family transcriptional regulator [Bradyrhizobium sp. USDA 4459]